MRNARRRVSQHPDEREFRSPTVKSTCSPDLFFSGVSPGHEPQGSACPGVGGCGSNARRMKKVSGGFAFATRAAFRALGSVFAQLGTDLGPWPLQKELDRALNLHGRVAEQPQ